MEYSIKQIVEAIGEGSLQGSGDYLISYPASLETSQAQNISFYANNKFQEVASRTSAGAIITTETLKGDLSQYKGNLVIVKNVMLAWAKTLRLWDQTATNAPWGIDPKAIIARTAKLGKNISLGALSVVEDKASIGERTVVHPQCYIGKNTVIGQDCIIYPQVVIRENCVIGDRVIIHPGTAIGADGYGFIEHQGRHEKIPQLGNVVIENDVEIGANVTIDRATVGSTIIGEGTKIDNLVQVAHNVQVGKHCLLVAQVGIAGSSKLGNYVILGGQAGVGDHIQIADGVIVGGGAGVIGDVKSKDVLWGTPARNMREMMRLVALMNKLPEIYDTVKKIKSAKTQTNDKK